MCKCVCVCGGGGGCNVAFNDCSFTFELILLQIFENLDESPAAFRERPALPQHLGLDDVLVGLESDKSKSG